MKVINRPQQKLTKLLLSAVFTLPTSISVVSIVPSPSYNSLITLGAWRGTSKTCSTRIFTKITSSQQLNEGNHWSFNCFRLAEINATSSFILLSCKLRLTIINQVNTTWQFTCQNLWLIRTKYKFKIVILLAARLTASRSGYSFDKTARSETTSTYKLKHRQKSNDFYLQ